MTQNINVKAKMSRTDKEISLLRGWYLLTYFFPSPKSHINLPSVKKSNHSLKENRMGPKRN